MNKINRMEEFVKEKERIQSSESQMAREVNYGSFFLIINFPFFYIYKLFSFSNFLLFRLNH